MTFLNVIFLIISVLLIVICLLQSGKSDGASGAITGGNLNVFVDNKDRGPEVILARVTMILGVLFFLLSLIIHYLIVK